MNHRPRLQKSNVKICAKLYENIFKYVSPPGVKRERDVNRERVCKIAQRAKIDRVF